MKNNFDYSLFEKFIKTFESSGFNGIDRTNSIILELERLMENNNQFFFIGDVVNFNILFTSNRSTQIIGIEPEKVSPYHFFESTHTDDIQRFSLARTKLFKLAQDFFVAKKGNILLSSNIKILGANGKYINLLFQCYMFYSETPVKTVYILQVHTNVDWCKMIKKEPHYYLGNDLSYFKYPDEALLQVGSVYTKREFEIIKLIELGFNTEQVAEKLFVSTNTVNVHRGNILKKSGKGRFSELIYDLKEYGML